MPEDLQAARSGLRFALVYTAPLVFWLLGQGWLASSGETTATVSLGQLLPVVLLLQVCTLPLALPWLLRSRGGRAHLAGLAMLLAVPLPLYAIAWAAGVVEVDSLLSILLFLCVLALFLYGYFRACVTWLPAGHSRSLVVVTSQVGLCLLGLAYHTAWPGIPGL